MIFFLHPSNIQTTELFCWNIIGNFFLTSHEKKLKKLLRYSSFSCYFYELPEKQVRVSTLFLSISYISIYILKIIVYKFTISFRAGEPEPVEAGCFWILGAGAKGKKNKEPEPLEN